MIFHAAITSSNWHNPEDPDDYSRITASEESFSGFEKMDLARMKDSVS